MKQEKRQVTRTRDFNKRQERKGYKEEETIRVSQSIYYYSIYENEKEEKKAEIKERTGYNKT